MFIRAEKMSRILVLNILFILVVLSKTYAANYQCGGDLNNNGIVEPSTETKACLSTPQGYLCPIGQTVCEIDQRDPICPSGTNFDPKKKKCVAIPTDGQCTYSGFTFDRSKGVCKKYVGILGICPSGAYYSGDYCYICAERAVCPEGTTYKCSLFQTSGWCEVSFTCPSGYNYDESSGKCVKAVCPLGNYPCMTTQRGVYCSSYTCVDIENPSNKETEEADLTGYTNDGTIDENGQCSGTVYIFNGYPGECRPKGTQTLYHNCCECEPDPQCKPQEQQTSCAVAAGSTQYIGEYCKEKWKLIGCVQKARVYCVFQSKLARIIHQQGRPQLIAFSPDGAWGTPKAPNCRGFTPEEFQNLDFSKIDLSEFIGEAVQNAQTRIQNLQQGLQNTIQQGIDNLQP